jgi:microbial collagenase
MTINQLQNACNKLIDQEQFFHKTLATRKQAVANDFNQSLRVVIFNNYSEYNRFGELVFDINTNNGGMYIEGTPSSPTNQATFFSFEAFWSQPAFKVWNLNHEYVHYLDGRFVKYGTFGHFPSHLVWWSEGIAEYISKGNDNPKVAKLLMDTTQDKWPNLQDIFATTYDDGSKRVYQWSYLAQQFIFTFYPEQGQQLAYYLKTDYFDGYKTLLDELAVKHQHEFELWLYQQLKIARNSKNKATASDLSKDKILKNKAHGIYRYLYRDYLYPQHLPKTDRHNHISNFG